MVPTEEFSRFIALNLRVPFRAAIDFIALIETTEFVADIKAGLLVDWFSAAHCMAILQPQLLQINRRLALIGGELVMLGQVADFRKLKDK